MTRTRVLFVFIMFFSHIVLIYAPMPMSWGLYNHRKPETTSIRSVNQAIIEIPKLDENGQRKTKDKNKKEKNKSLRRTVYEACDYGMIPIYRKLGMTTESLNAELFCAEAKKAITELCKDAIFKICAFAPLGVIVMACQHFLPQWVC